jgi:hypothetical protein
MNATTTEKMRVTIEQWDGVWKTSTGRLTDRWGYRATLRHYVPGKHHVTTQCPHVHRTSAGATDCALGYARAGQALRIELELPDNIAYRLETEPKLRKKEGR